MYMLSINRNPTFSLWVRRLKAGVFALYYKDGTPFTQLTFPSFGDAKDYGELEGYAVSLYVE